MAEHKFKIGQSVYFRLKVFKQGEPADRSYLVIQQLLRAEGYSTDSEAQTTRNALQVNASYGSLPNLPGDGEHTAEHRARTRAVRESELRFCGMSAFPPRTTGRGRVRHKFNLEALGARLNCCVSAKVKPLRSSCLEFDQIAS
jgi:hypothetical protein